jgi:hypothetical protein
MRTGRLTASVVAVAMATLLGGAASLEAAPILVGTLGGGAPIDENCIPFGCPTTIGIGLYQQVYSSTVFSGPTTINSITFFDTFSSILPNPNAVTPATYTFRLSTTARAVGLLSTTLASNVGADDALFFSGLLGGPIAGTRLTIAGAPFLYNPAGGNLLLQIQVSGAGIETGVSMDADFENGLFSRAFNNNFAPTGVDADGLGLVTEFNATVPEPATLLLLGGGLASAGWRRRRAHARR